MHTIIEENQNTKTAKSFRSVKENSLLCRICFDSETKTNKLIRPCACSGTVAFVHNSCLEQWVRTTANIRCSICQGEFELVPSGVRYWKDCTWPSPLSDSNEDVMDFACTIAWLIYMGRFAYITMRYGTNALFNLLDESMGDGTIKYIWWLSFWFNFAYYGAMASLIYDKWIFENTLFCFKDRSEDITYKSLKSSSIISQKSRKTARKMLYLDTLPKEIVGTRHPVHAN